MDSLSKISDIPNSFKVTYGNIIQTLNNVLRASSDELISFSKTMDPTKKEEYKEIIMDCIKEGNDILRTQFVNDLAVKNQQIIDTSEHKIISTSDGKSIDIY